jgi:hypothetical protein
MCPQCDAFGAPLGFSLPSQYHRFVDHLRAALAAGELTLVSGNVDLDAIAPGRPWPGADDALLHVVRGPRCGQRFRLVVDTYHGGGSWQRVA